MKYRNLKIEQGQTLIETVVAIFILTIGIVSALGLANYAVSTSTNIVKQIIGMGLAREGIEAVKNMRDTNWLKDYPLASDCYNFETSDQTGNCYKNWLNLPSGYNINPASGSQSYTLNINASGVAADYWQLVPASSAYGLNYTSGVPSGNSPYYTSGGISSGYYRKITIAKDTTAPFDHAADLGPRVTVTSEVWWNGKKCPAATADNPPATGSCKIKLQMYLTNWKNY